MTAPDHLKISGPEDILGFIPHSLGYWPANSVVAMTMQGPRLGATLRVDLPEPGRYRRSALASFARAVAGYLAADQDADGSLLAIFTGQPPGGPHGRVRPDPGTRDDGVVEDRELGSGADPESDWQPARAAGGALNGRPGGVPGSATASMPGGVTDRALDRLVGELESALDAAGLPVRDAWVVGERYWRNAHCQDPACCAPPGRPVDEIRDSIVNAELVFRGSRVGAAPGTAAPGGPLAEARPEALAAERRWEREFSGRSRGRTQFNAVLDVWERVLEPAGSNPGRLPDGLAGYLRASLCVAAWRDAVLVMAAAGRAAALAGIEDFGLLDGAPARPGGAVPLPDFEDFAPPVPGRAARGELPGHGDVPGYGEVLLGLEPDIPDWARLAGLDRILQQLADFGGGEARAAALTARGWIEWCRGRGSYAAALYGEAAGERPGYRLAELLGELARRGTLCGWAARKESAWQKFDPDAA